MEDKRCWVPWNWDFQEVASPLDMGEIGPLQEQRVLSDTPYPCLVIS